VKPVLPICAEAPSRVIGEIARTVIVGFAIVPIAAEARVELALVRKSLLLMRQSSLISAKTPCFQGIMRKRKLIVREIQLLVSFSSLAAAGSHFTRE
jgi:hypothetical protein